MPRRILAALALILATLAGTSSANASTTCATPVRLYDGVNYTGPVLSTAIRWTYIDLASHGFDNRTSSIRAGACPIDLYTGPWGTGSMLRLAAWQSVPNLGGWANTASSIYVY